MKNEPFGWESARAYFDIRANSLQTLRAACERGPAARDEIATKLALVHHQLDRLLVTEPAADDQVPGRRAADETEIAVTQGKVGAAEKAVGSERPRVLTKEDADRNAAAAQGLNVLPPPLGEAPPPTRPTAGGVRLGRLARSPGQRARARIQVAHALIRELNDVLEFDPPPSWQASFAAILSELDSVMRRVEPPQSG